MNIFLLSFFLVIVSINTSASLDVLPVEITNHILTYASDNYINYDTIIAYRICNTICESHGTTFLESCFKRRYQNFPWLYQEDKNFDKDFYPDFLQQNNINKKIIDNNESNLYAAEKQKFHQALEKNLFIENCFSGDQDTYNSKIIKSIEPSLSKYPYKKTILKIELDYFCKIQSTGPLII